MAGRPASGSKRRRGNRIEASVALPGGGRCSRSFGPEDDVDGWIAAAIEAARTGAATPDAEQYRRAGQGSGRPPAVTGPLLVSGTPPMVPIPGFAPCPLGPTLRAWHDREYDQRQAADLERRDAVLRMVNNHIIPWWGEEADMARITDEQCLAFARHLAGSDRARDGTRLPPIDATRELTLKEASRLVGRSVPVLRRAYKNRRFPNARLDLSNRTGGVVLVPIGDLATAGFWADRHDVTRRRALSPAYAREVLWVLRAGFAYARSRLALGHDPLQGVRALPPAPDLPGRAPATARAKAYSLSQCAKVATHLHVVHQLVLLLQRVLGLRVSEAFGIDLQHLVPLSDGMGLVVIEEQGGRTFRYRDPFGQPVTAPSKPRGKTASAYRFIVVPASLWELLSVFITAFHADIVTGEWPGCGRLVPGLRTEGHGGVAAYRDSLTAAMVAAGHHFSVERFHASTHHLRKSLGAELAYIHGLDDHLRSRILGLRLAVAAGASTVVVDHYTPDTAALAPFVAAARKLDEQIRQELGTLVIPTARRPLLGKGNPMRTRLHHIDDILIDAGWHLPLPGSDEHPLLDVSETAAELGYSPTHARLLLRSGAIRSQTVPGPAGGLQRSARLDDVIRYRDRHGSRHHLPDVAAELRIPYERLWRQVQTGQLQATRDAATGQWYLEPEAVESIRARLAAQEALAARAEPLSEAARMLDMSVSTLRHHVRAGAVEMDPETDATGRHYLIRASLERFAAERDAARRHNGGSRLEGYVPLSDVLGTMNWTQPEALKSLRRAGVRIRRDASYRFHVNALDLGGYLSRAWPTYVAASEAASSGQSRAPLPPS